jgi:hypothetical protein
MLLFSSDNYFAFGMSSILKDIHTPNIYEKIVLFDRGNGVISVMTKSTLNDILRKDEPFIEFIQSEFLSINKNIAISGILKIPQLLLLHLKSAKNLTIRLTATERYILKSCFIENNGVHSPDINRKRINHCKRVILNKLKIKNNAELLSLVNCWRCFFDRCTGMHSLAIEYSDMMDANSWQ